MLVAGAAFGWWWYQEKGFGGFGTEDATDSTDPAAVSATLAEVLVDARPWGRIEKVVDTASADEVSLPAGSLFTPRLVELEEGSYEVTLSHPDGGSRSCRVEVGEGSASACEVRFFDTEPRAFFQEMGW